MRWLRFFPVILLGIMGVGYCAVAAEPGAAAEQQPFLVTIYTTEGKVTSGELLRYIDGYFQIQRKGDVGAVNIHYAKVAKVQFGVKPKPPVSDAMKNEAGPPKAKVHESFQSPPPGKPRESKLTDQQKQRLREYFDRIKQRIGKVEDIGEFAQKVGEIAREQSAPVLLSMMSHLGREIRAAEKPSAKHLRMLVVAAILASETKL